MTATLTRYKHISPWLALAWSAVASIVLSGLALALPVLPAGGIAGLLADCLMELRAQYAHPGRATRERCSRSP